jgi:hypothetical protein
MSLNLLQHYSSKSDYEKEILEVYNTVMEKLRPVPQPPAISIE